MLIDIEAWKTPEQPTREPSNNLSAKSKKPEINLRNGDHTLKIQELYDKIDDIYNDKQDLVK